MGVRDGWGGTPCVLYSEGVRRMGFKLLSNAGLSCKACNFGFVVARF